MERVFSSPLSRARESAEAIAAFHECSVTTDARLAEVDFGPFEAHTPSELMDGPLAESFRQWRNERASESPKGIESLETAVRRAREFFHDVRDLPGTTVVVTHGVFARIILCSCVLELDARLFRRLRIDNARLSTIVWERGLPKLVGLNTERL